VIEDGATYAECRLAMRASASSREETNNVVKRSIQYFLMLMMAVGVVTVVSASPASASGGCGNDPIIGSCIDYGAYGSFAHGDFYMNVAPNGNFKTAKVQFVVNGKAGAFKPAVTIVRGRNTNGLWNVSMASLPISTKSVYFKVTVYTSTGGLYGHYDSPTIVVRA
jgi:hypothetical protein